MTPLPLQLHRGFTLLETTLFLGILSIIAGTIVAVFLSTQNARVQQLSVARVEQEGSQIVAALGKTIRRAEQIMAPASDLTGSILTLQMASNSEFPVIIARVGSGLVLAQKAGTSSLLSPNVTASALTFRNLGGSNVWFSFTLTTRVGAVPVTTFTRHFTGTATLFPDDQSDAGGCGSCPAPSCINNRYTWYICDTAVCTQSDTTLPC